MIQLQDVADAAEEAAIRRLHAFRLAGAAAILKLSCRHCGTLQAIRAETGMRRFRLVCCSCRGKTLIDVA